MKLESDRSFALAQFAASLSRHSAIGETELHALQELPATIRRVRSHDSFVRPGDQLDAISVLVSGVVARVTYARNGEARYTALFMTGDVCDIQSVIQPVARSGLEALTSVMLCSIPRTALERLIQQSPVLALAFWRATAIEESKAAAWVANLNRKATISRIAHLICEIGVRSEHARSGQRGSVPWTLTQQQVADVVGVTPIHVNRTVQALKAMGLVRSAPGRMEVPDWPALAKLGEFDEDYLFIERPGRAQHGGSTTSLGVSAQRH